MISETGLVATTTESVPVGAVTGVLAGFLPPTSDWGQTVVPTEMTVVTREVDLAGQSVTVLAHRVMVKIWVDEMVEVTRTSPGMVEVGTKDPLPVTEGARVKAGDDEAGAPDDP